MRVFLSYAVGPVDSTIAARLRAVAAAYNISILLPDRTPTNFNKVAPDTLKKIQQSDAVIALMTGGAQITSINVVNQELATAQQQEKPIIALVEQGVPVVGVPANQVVRFNPLIPHQHEPALMEVLQQIQRQQRKKDFAVALGWIAGIALGLVALSELVDDKK